MPGTPVPGSGFRGVFDDLFRFRIPGIYPEFRYPEIIATRQQNESFLNKKPDFYINEIIKQIFFHCTACFLLYSNLISEQLHTRSREEICKK